MASVPTSREQDRSVADRYRLVRTIGSGGMGTVFEAEDLRLGRRCAVKMLREEVVARPSAQRRFNREASVLGRLVHENIVALLDAGVDRNGSAYLVLEYLQGRTLRAELQEAGVRSVQRTLEIVAQIARGLDHAHARGVVHRDLKPENIMLTRHADGRLLVKLLDFGIARLGDGAGELVTATESAIGTAAYMAPEQARGERVLQATTDVYALGVVIYEALAGRRPYEGGSYNETLFQILSRTHKPLAEVRPDLPAELCSAVERALEKAPLARFASVGDFVAALAAVDGAHGHGTEDAPLGSLETTAVPVEERGGTAVSRGAGRSSAWRLAACGIAGAVIGALGSAALHRGSHFGPAPGAFGDTAGDGARAPVEAAPALLGHVPAEVAALPSVPAPAVGIPAAAAVPSQEPARVQGSPADVGARRETRKASSPVVPASSSERASKRPPPDAPASSETARVEETHAKMLPGYIVESPYPAATTEP